MKNLVIVFLSCFLLLACSDVVDLSQTKDAISNDALKNANGVSTLDIGPVNPYMWTKLQVPAMANYPMNHPDKRNLIITVNGNVFCLIGDSREVVYKLNTITKRWEHFSDPHSMYMWWVGAFNYLFSYQSKFYYGFQMGHGGEDQIGSLDPITGDKDDILYFPGTPVDYPTCFVVGSKAYIIGGIRGNVTINQFWEYDFNTHLWTDKGGIPGGARAGATAFVHNNKVYFGLGYSIITLNGTPIKRFKNDWYMMDPTTGGYAAIKADFPGTSKNYPGGFTINNKFYLSWGESADFWEYNPANNKWTQKDDLPVNSSGRHNTTVFALDNTGYVVKGWLNSFWRYSNSSIVPVP